MNQNPSDIVQSVQIMATFLSNNFWKLFFLIVFIVYRESLSNLIKRLTEFTLKKGDAQLGMKAAKPEVQVESVVPEKVDDLVETTERNKQSVIDGAAKEQNLMVEMHTAFDENRIDDAKEAFENYANKEKDKLKVEENKALFLYLLFTKGKDNSAINQLEELVNKTSNEESKFNALTWLSFCFDESSQSDKKIELWEESLSSFKSHNLITQATVSLADALNRTDKHAEARKLLDLRLKNESDSKSKAKIYSKMALIEKSLGNMEFFIYCKDKAQELNPNDRGELFDTAYQASNEGIKNISISNYLTLLHIDSHNAAALNNLGVFAEGEKLQVQAIEKYKKSSKYGNTLAMANQGYALIKSGFLNEAETIANQAVELDDTHENIYSLLVKIKELKKEQTEKWQKIASKAQKNQKLIRGFTYAYYEGEENDFVRKWAVNNNKINMDVTQNQLSASWVEENKNALLKGEYAVSLEGNIHNSAFIGKYKRIAGEGIKSTILGGSENKDIDCLGFLSNDKTSFSIFSKSDAEELDVKLERIDKPKETKIE